MQLMGPKIASPRIQLRISRSSITAAFVSILFALTLVGCGKGAAAQNSAAQLVETQRVEFVGMTNAATNASTTLQPESGYGGLYIQVNGKGWPQNMMILVTLEDEQGRSDTLAAADTDQAGNLATGFLLPIDQRWLASKSLWVVSTTADGKIETKSKFTVVAPGTPVAESPAAQAAETEAAETEHEETEALETEDNNDAAASVDETLVETEPEYTVVMPLIVSTGPDTRAGRASRNATTRTTARMRSTGALPVQVFVGSGNSGRIDCRNGQGWVTVTIFSNDGFDATQVDPASVSVVGSTLGAIHQEQSSVVPAAYSASAKESSVAANRQAYQWTWQHADANGDGNADMVMEFRLDYLDLECNAAVVSVLGRTKDGAEFEGIYQTELLVVERS